MFEFRQFVDFNIFGRHRLEQVRMPPLGSTIDQVIRLYGEPIKTAPFEEAPDITEYVFSASPYHEAVIYEWEDKVQSITYWSAKGEPTRDLNCMLDRYREDSEWQVLQPGYLYQRADGKFRLWCSAISAIGIAYVDYLSAQADMKTAHELKQLDHLSDVTWVSNKVVHELQRQFVEERSTRLKDLASRSDRIAISPDGKDVFIVRHHHAYEVEEGLRELNSPPKAGEGSTQVINCFSWSEDGSSWGKAPLPRNAHVEYLRFEEGLWHLQIRRTTDDRIFRFKGPTKFIRSLGPLNPFREAEVWRELEKDAESSAPSTE
ncbi:hypothetical protein CfE428DRAFT_0721 [Chthoniobacter flavus Ellin428]|uniref:Uncharacterized protein n=1 Tax=Chthoniobacter flavus Ellin428 TaxID=497964 RepID=B4CVN4_9BACT|nr:hypothetical protein [Chthoniobacter flavus]EDY21476.1 hypothetical protein CfE428DRAFT_0721 [Chthoniobacter flavus Ellin428]TCO95428.1 hypothetical protein EV701_101115 [Chthoniobacter flavus]